MQILIQAVLDVIWDAEFLTSFYVMLMLLDGEYTLFKEAL